MDSFRNACFAVASGMYDIALVVGVEKMRASSSRSLVESMITGGQPYLIKGRTAPGIFPSWPPVIFINMESGENRSPKLWSRTITMEP